MTEVRDGITSLYGIHEYTCNTVRKSIDKDVDMTPVHIHFSWAAVYWVHVPRGDMSAHVATARSTGIVLMCTLQIKPAWSLKHILYQ